MGQLQKLRIDYVITAIKHVVVCDQMIRDDPHLRLYLSRSRRDRIVQIPFQNTEMEHNAGTRVVGAMLTSVSTDSIINGYEYIQSRAFLLEIVAMVVISPSPFRHFMIASEISVFPSLTA
mgnify:CR=1 FL=1